MLPNANASKRVDLFVEKLFANGNYCKELFKRLCEEGCSPDDLSGLLFAVCTLAVADRHGLFIDLSDISKAQLRQLTTGLHSLADLVERVNRTRLNPKLDLLTAAPDAERDAVRKHVGRLYDMLPGLMRGYAFHLERFSKFSRAILKRMTPTHLRTLRLLLYIEENTGGPRYEQVSNLLSAGFMAAGGNQNQVPKFFSSDALAKLKQRTAKFGLTSRF